MGKESIILFEEPKGLKGFDLKRLGILQECKDSVKDYVTKRLQNLDGVVYACYMRETTETLDFRILTDETSIEDISSIEEEVNSAPNIPKYISIFIESFECDGKHVFGLGEEVEYSTFLNYWKNSGDYKKLKLTN